MTELTTLGKVKAKTYIRMINVRLNALSFRNDFRHENLIRKEIMKSFIPNMIDDTDVFAENLVSYWSWDSYIQEIEVLDKRISDIVGFEEAFSDAIRDEEEHRNSSMMIEYYSMAGDFAADFLDKLSDQRHEKVVKLLQMLKEAIEKELES